MGFHYILNPPRIHLAVNCKNDLISKIAIFDVASRSAIAPCIEIDKQLVVNIFSYLM